MTIFIHRSILLRCKPSIKAALLPREGSAVGREFNYRTTRAMSQIALPEVERPLNESKSFDYTIKRIRFDENYEPADSTRATTTRKFGAW